MMLEKIGKAAMYEQLAEECTELAQAALKMARKMRNENPTPKSATDIWENLIEEVSDVCTCFYELGLKPDVNVQRKKMDRFEKRWEKYEKARL